MIKILFPTMLLAGVLAGCALTAQAANDLYPEAHPPAGIQPKRPANYQPYKYPLSPRELLAKDGPTVEKLAKAAA